MLHHHTVDPGERAADIAERESEIIWQKTGSYDAWLSTWMSVYVATLREFNGGSGSTAQ